jgi:hypothetical protein
VQGSQTASLKGLSSPSQMDKPSSLSVPRDVQPARTPTLKSALSVLMDFTLAAESV